MKISCIFFILFTLYTLQYHIDHTLNCISQCPQDKNKTICSTLNIDIFWTKNMNCYFNCNVSALYSHSCSCPNNCYFDRKQGICTNGNCQCEKGWKGKDFSIVNCPENKCSNHVLVNFVVVILFGLVKIVLHQ